MEYIIALSLIVVVLGLGVVAFYARWLAFFLAFGHSSADDSHGGQYVPPAVDDAQRRRPQPKTHDADDAAGFHRDVHQLPFGFNHLLVGEQRSQYRAAISHQPHGAIGQSSLRYWIHGVRGNRRQHNR